MLFYRPADQATFELRNPRIRFFFLGPFYLLWLRLWREAVVVGLVAWLLVHTSVQLSGYVAPGSAGLDPRAALGAMERILAASQQGVAAEVALRELFMALLPFYAAAITLLIVMVALTGALPAYLRRYYARLGWQPAIEDAELDPERPALEL